MSSKSFCTFSKAASNTKNDQWETEVSGNIDK